MLIQKELKKHKELLSDDQTSDHRFDTKIKQFEEVVEKKVNQELQHIRQEIETKFEQRLKQLAHNYANQEKRIDKVASSILGAVDQKFIKD